MSKRKVPGPIGRLSPQQQQQQQQHQGRTGIDSKRRRVEEHTNGSKSKRRLPISITGDGKTRRHEVNQGNGVPTIATPDRNELEFRVIKSAKRVTTPKQKTKRRRVTPNQKQTPPPPLVIAKYDPPELVAKVLLPFQKEGIQFALKQGARCIIGDDMGLGKTIQAIVTMWHHRESWPLLVIVPSSVRVCWVDELEKWLPSVLGPTDINLVRSGKDIANLDAKVTIVTYGLLAQKTLQTYIMGNAFKCVIVDESHYLKNRQAKRTQALMPILHAAQHVLLLSGTPALARPEELYSQLDAIAPGKFGTFTVFAQRYCNAHRTRFGWDTRGSSNLQELHAKLQDGVMVRRLKINVLDQLPPKRRTVVTLPSLPTNVLDKFKTDFKDLKEMGDDASPFDRGVVMSRMYVDTGKSKIEHIQDYIKDLCHSGSKFLVFAAHLDVVEAIRSTVEKEKIEYMLINGATPPAERFDNVTRFQTDDKCKVAILSLLAASQGITLTAADTVVFAELHWTPGIIEQAENRAHRIGQKNSVNVHYLLARGTMDDLMWPLLNNKVKVITTTLDGKGHCISAKQQTLPDKAPPRTCPGCGDSIVDCTCFAVDGDGDQPTHTNTNTNNNNDNGNENTTNNSPNGNNTNNTDTLPMTATTLTDEVDPASLRKVLGEILPEQSAAEYDVTDVRFFFSGGAKKLMLRRESSGDHNNKSTAAVTWTCTDCTFMNKKRAPACSMCGKIAPKPLIAPRSSTKSASTTDTDVNADGDVDVVVDESVAAADGVTLVKDDVKDGVKDAGKRKSPLLHFCVSAHTGRMFLYDENKHTLGCAVTQNEALSGELDAIPPHLHTCEKEIRQFALNWRKLRAVEQKLLQNNVIARASQATVRKFQSQQSVAHLDFGKVAGNGKAAGGLVSTERYTTREAFSQHHTNVSDVYVVKKANDNDNDNDNDDNDDGNDDDNDDDNDDGNDEVTISESTPDRHPTVYNTAPKTQRATCPPTPSTTSTSTTTPSTTTTHTTTSPTAPTPPTASTTSAATSTTSPSTSLPTSTSTSPSPSASNNSRITSPTTTTTTATTRVSSSGVANTHTSTSACKQRQQPTSSKKCHRTTLNEGFAIVESNQCLFCKSSVPELPWGVTETKSNSKTQQLQQQTTSAKFCSHECWEQYNVRIGSSIRRQMLELEHGVCQICQLDTQKLYRSVCALQDVNDRRTLLMKTCFKNLLPVRFSKILSSPNFGQFWQADHIIPVREGGGECDISNLRTLCTICHAKETSALNSSIKKQKLKKSAKGTKDIRGFFSPGSQKKATKEISHVVEIS